MTPATYRHRHLTSSAEESLQNEVQAAEAGEIRQAL